MLKFTGTQSLFSPEDQINLLLVASLSTINRTKDLAELSLKSVIAAIDTKDSAVSEKIFKLIFGEFYLYKDFREREDQESNMLGGDH